MAGKLKLCKCGCGGEVKSSGALYCKGHFSRFRAHGERMPMHHVQCGSCQRAFTKRYHITGRNAYCSHPCYIAARRAKAGWSPEGRNCEHCGQKFIASFRNPKQRFCGKECFDSSRRIYDDAAVTCTGCGRPTTLRRGRARNKLRRFCSHACYLKHTGRTAGVNKDRRNTKKEHNAYILKRPQRCQICGFDRYVEWAHLIPRRDGGSAASINIIILCPNHHRLYDCGLLNPSEQSIVDNLLAIARADPLAKVSLAKSSRYSSAPTIQKNTGEHGLECERT